MKRFDSWREAFNYQQGSCVDSSDPFWMVNDIDSDIVEIDNVGATTKDEVVWLIAVEDENGTETQYGVGKNQKWYSVKVDHSLYRTEIVTDSLKEFSQLPNLINFDHRAGTIYKHIDKLFEVYGFLVNGKIEEEDVVNQAYVNNAEKIKAYAKQQVQKDHSLYHESDDTDDDDFEEHDYTDHDTDFDTSEYTDTDTSDDTDSDIDTSEDTDSWDDTDTDTNTDYDPADFDTNTDTDIDDSDTSGLNDDTDESEVEVEVEVEAPCCDTDESPKIGRDKSYEYKTDMFKFTISNERDGEKDTFVFEGTDEEAKLKFQELIDLGYKFVEQAKLQSVFVSFE